ncbi:NADP-specific glutamate dehydrogenase [Legionella adelaidensis]|uniref:Glutamate dehydrogenase n=1 Tax=Legionella adelaidensis TaxID=45056 RepID=A0A0W0R6A1_9GAMM|nr:NADP-specific glutamate dehydrogenase [Legionella adelaidensis]KTC66558.1 NADP-specific glutamate dehydrogenase [Legionella adelaidensis]
MHTSIKKLLITHHPNQPELHQAVMSIYNDIEEFYFSNAAYREHKVLEQLLEPDRIIRFRVAWEDDNHEIQVNRGWRIQYQNILGPYKGGIRFSPDVNEGVLKFLGFEQCFKNALTNLPIGGAKGGADFDPKGKSEKEIRRFCWAFIEELRKYIGTNIDVPAGDMGVGVREIGYMYGHFIKLDKEFTGALTGKGTNFGGSAGREQATGHGCVYFLESMLDVHQDDLANKKVVISGSGNVALHAAEKCLEKGAKVFSLSDREGFIHFKQGLNQELLDTIKELKLIHRGRLKNWADKHKAVEFFKKRKPWGLPCHIALPCATQNEIGVGDMKELINNKVRAICEGANMPLTAQAEELVLSSPVLYGPGKAANAGGVAVSVLEQAQNAQHMVWPLEKVDKELQQIMLDIHGRCIENNPPQNGKLNYKRGANLWAFKKIADTLVTYGIK